MCGIVGLFLKDISLEANLGNLLSDMLISMSDRGPDSAGIAIYADKENGRSKFTIQSENAKTDFEALPNYLSKHLNFELVNINDEPEYYYWGDKTRLSQYDEYGSTVNFGARYSF